MEAAHRYRILIIFAALVFCLSVCFANAEETHSAHAFMAPLQQTFVHETAASAATPTVSNNLLQQLTAEKPHRFAHAFSFAKRKPGLIVSHPKDAATGVSVQSAQDASRGADGGSRSE